MAGALLQAAAGAGMGGTAALLSVTAGPAGAQPISNCSTTAGVVVVVDFSPWGGTAERGCAATPTTGYGALHTAGFTTAGTTRDGPAFICRIDTRPAPTQTPCTDTPPVSAHWVYWHAGVGQTTWSYSPLGAVTAKPSPGSVTAWIFGPTNGTGASGSGRPPFTPTQVRATNTTPVGGGGGGVTTTTGTPTTPTTGSATAPSGATGTTVPAGGSVTPTTGTPPTGAGSGSVSTSTTAPDSDAGGTTTTVPVAGGGVGGESGTGQKGQHRAGARPKIIDVDPASVRTRASSGSAAPLVVGGIVVVVVAGTGGLIAWRRRRAGQAG